MQLLKPAWVATEGQALMSIDIHPDGTRFATGGQGVDCGRISIWNMKPVVDGAAAKDKSIPRLLTRMEHHEGCVNCVRWSRNGKYLASGGDDKLVMIWERSAYAGGAMFGGGGKSHVEMWRLSKTLRSHSGDVLHLAWGPGDLLLATASVDNTVILWNAENFPEIVTTLKGHTGLVKGVVFDPVGRFLATQSDDKTIRIWRSSDWTQEAIIDKPFVETGATTEVLRPDWSPDGSMLVSAHAMNGGGPTAQIIDRAGWKTQRDFVGHRKAVACVRFNENIVEQTGVEPAIDNGLKKSTADKDTRKPQMFATVALGSRDRSFSVWCTHLKRPLFVINDVFDQSVLDLSWSSDGQILMACSTDGSAAAVVMTPQEIGIPIPKEKLFDLMSHAYGKNFGKASIASAVNKANGTIVIENPDMLKPSHYSNGHVTPEQSPKLKLYPKGPTDKQIETRTSDGKRRITPMFICPQSVDNGVGGSDSTNLTFGSSSTQEKSRIAIEKRDDIVVPNVSPGKYANDGSNHSLMGRRCTNAIAAATTTATTATTTSTGTTVSLHSEDDPATKAKVNVLQVKRKPIPQQQKPSDKMANAKGISTQPQAAVTSLASASCLPQKPPPQAATCSAQEPSGKLEKTTSTSAATNPVAAGTFTPKKRKKLAVISSSSEGDSDSDSNDSYASQKSAINCKKTMAASDNHVKGSINTNAALPDKLKDCKLRKPDMLALKRKPTVPTEVEDAGASSLKKRARPTFSREVFHENSTAAPTACSGLVGSHLNRILPLLKASKSRTSFSFNVDSFRVCVDVENDLVVGQLHRVKCHFAPNQTWETLMSSPVSTVANGENLIVVACHDGSLHIFAAASGMKLYPPLVLSSPVSKLAVNKFRLAVVTVGAKLYLWDLRVPKVLMRNECIVSLLSPADGLGTQSGVYIAKLHFCQSGQPVVVTSAGKAFTYDQDLGTWLRLVDSASAIQSVSDFATAAANLPAETCGLPLATLSYLTPHTAKLVSVPDQVRTLASLTHCRDQILSAKYLSSAGEYKYWLLSYVKQLSKEGKVEKLRTQLDELLGPVTSSQQSQWEPTVLGLDKRSILKAALKIISNNLELQRVYAEYVEQLNAQADLKDIDNLLQL